MGGEQIEVDRFEVRDSMLGETFTLRAGRAGTYTLENSDFGTNSQERWVRL